MSRKYQVLCSLSSRYISLWFIYTEANLMPHSIEPHSRLSQLEPNNMLKRDWANLMIRWFDLIMRCEGKERKSWINTKCYVLIDTTPSRLYWVGEKGRCVEEGASEDVVCYVKFLSWGLWLPAKFVGIGRFFCSFLSIRSIHDSRIANDAPLAGSPRTAAAGA